jgi:hypothetical protein
LADLGEGSVSAGGEGESSGCQTRDFIAEFNLTVAFDAAPVPVAEGETPGTVAEGAEETASSTESGSSESEGTTSE